MTALLLGSESIEQLARMENISVEGDKISICDDSATVTRYFRILLDAQYKSSGERAEVD